ncbi:MAG: cytosine deaminase [Proteobacteria bacterium]|nr:cytosine deaminase [Pseudomonadota bacterium]
MLYRNLCIENSDVLKDVRVCEGIFSEIGENLLPSEGEEVVDLGGCLMLPPFIEPHIHLDSALTAGEPRWNASGTLFEGIEIWSERKKRLDKADVMARASEAIHRLAVHGVQFVRTHVDSTDPSLVAMEAILELRETLRGVVDIQVVAFPQDGIMSSPGSAQLLEQCLRMGADAVGAIPHYEFTREYSVESLNLVMKLAEKYGALVDVHCDEIDDEASRGLETLACRALESGLKSRVTASHTTAMHSYNNAYAAKLFRLLRLSEINFIANPLINTHLQGRLDTYPKRRGVTRVRELLANGNHVAFGHDDIFDPWYPLGNGQPMDVIHMGIHVTQSMGYDEIMQSYRFCTWEAAHCLNLSPTDYGIREGNAANFIILNAKHWYEALNVRAEVLLSVRNGKVIARTSPRQAECLIPWLSK